MASSSHTDTSGVTWGRPSPRTVVTHDSWAVSKTSRAFAHGVALAPGPLNRASSSGTSSGIVVPLAEGRAPSPVWLLSPQLIWRNSTQRPQPHRPVGLDSRRPNRSTGRAHRPWVLDARTSGWTVD